MARILAVLMFLWLLPAVTSTAAAVDDASAADYARAERLMREGDWVAAGAAFEALMRDYPSSEFTDVFLFQRARVAFHLGEWENALDRWREYFADYPDSPERAYAHLSLANTLYHLDRGDSAFAHYMSAWRQSEDSRLTDLARRPARSLAASTEVSVATVQSVLEESSDPNRVEYQTIAEGLVARGEVDLASELLAACGLDLADLAPAEKPVATPSSHKTLTLAMVLPFSGELRGYADDLYRGAVVGAELAFEKYGLRPVLRRYDTEGDPITAARILAELNDSREATLGIGPLTSEAAMVCAATLACNEFTLIIPAATEAGLTHLSESAFQLSPNIELQGVRAAEYAAQEIKAREAAIITPTSQEHLRMARAFANRFEELGGDVMAVEYYRARDNDFGPYISDLKRMLLGVPPDSVFHITPDGDTLDPDGVPVELDCLYLPGRSHQLSLLLPQIRFYRISARYIGSDGWGEDEILRLGDQVTRDAVFTSPFLGVGTTEDYFALASGYDALFGGPPPRLAAFGYDAVMLAAATWSKGRSAQRQLARELARTSGYVGAAGPIRFGANRENVEMPLYRISDGTAVPVTGDAALNQTTP